MLHANYAPLLKSIMSSLYVWEVSSIYDTDFLLMYSASHRFHLSVDTSSRHGHSTVCMCVCWDPTLSREYGINPSSTQSLCGRLCPAETGTTGHVSLHRNQITATAHLCMDGQYYVGVWKRAHWQTRVSQKQRRRTNFLVYTIILPTGLDNEATLNQCQLNWWHMTKQFHNYFLVTVFCIRIFYRKTLQGQFTQILFLSSFTHHTNLSRFSFSFPVGC